MMRNFVFLLTALFSTYVGAECGVREYPEIKICQETGVVRCAVIKTSMYADAGGGCHLKMVAHSNFHNEVTVPVVGFSVLLTIPACSVGETMPEFYDRPPRAYCEDLPVADTTFDSLKHMPETRRVRVTPVVFDGEIRPVKLTGQTIELTGLAPIVGNF